MNPITIGGIVFCIIVVATVGVCSWSIVIHLNAKKEDEKGETQ